MTFDQFMEVARTLVMGDGFEDVEVEAYYVAPKIDIEIFDRATDVEKPLNFSIATYAGETPVFRYDGRRYRRRFRQIPGYGEVAVTFASSYYWLTPQSAVAQTKRHGDSHESRALSCRILICDIDNRLNLPAWLPEQINEDSEEDAKPLPIREHRQMVNA